MDWFVLLGILTAIIVVVALSLTTWKKKLRPHAERKEIITLAILLSIVLTTSLAVGLAFPGLPWALVAYILCVFFVQWLVSQAFLDNLFKAWLKKKGYKLE